MIDIVNLSLTVGEANEVFNDFNDIFLCKGFLTQCVVEVEFLVNLVTTHFSEIITLVTEEQFVNDATGRFVVRRISTTQLLVDVLNRFKL